MDLITSLTSQVMNKALDGLSKRHKAISSNLANVDTPNYHRRDVSFEDSLTQAIEGARDAGVASKRPATNDEPLAMRTTSGKHFANRHMFQSLDEVQPQFVENEDLQYRNDGNSVDVENEMAQLAKNTQKYLAVTNLQSRAFRSLKSIISGGGS
jgi:flagellar basal-body rod protein FlgB